MMAFRVLNSHVLVGASPKKLRARVASLELLLNPAPVCLSDLAPVHQLLVSGILTNNLQCDQAAARLLSFFL